MLEGPVSGALNSQLGARLIMDTLASLVENGYLGNRLTRQEREQAELERDPAAGLTKRQRGEFGFAENRALACVPSMSKRASTSSRRRISWGRDAPDGTAIGNGLRL